jgi:cyclopropane-fatty-acyl-phospholipid synthase
VSSAPQRLSLQTIVYENFNERAGNSFVTETFRESDLPRLPEIVDAAAGLFEVVKIRNDRDHYARTLRVWYQSLRNQRAAIVERFGKDLFCQYEKYLGSSSSGFTQNRSL